MPLTITKQTGGYFLFETGSQKRGATIVTLRHINDEISFIDKRKQFIEGPQLYSGISVYDGDTEITGLDTAAKVADALVGLGMNMEN